MKRRSFLKLAAAGSALPLFHIAAAPCAKTIAAGRRIRVALIGCGIRMRDVLSAKLEDVEIVALVDQKKADEAYEERMNAGKTEIRQRAERAERAAKLQGRKDALALKQSILARAYDRAKEKLLALPEQEYTAFLSAQAGNAAVTGHEQVVVNGQDRSMGEEIVRGANAILTKRGLPAGLTLSDENGDFSGGLKLREGSVEVNCTVDTLLALSRNALDAEIASVLFG